MNRRYNSAAYRILFLLHASTDPAIRRPKPYIAHVDCTWIHRASRVVKERTLQCMTYLQEAGFIKEWQTVLDGSYVVLLNPLASSGAGQEGVKFDQEGVFDGQGE